MTAAKKRRSGDFHIDAVAKSREFYGMPLEDAIRIIAHNREEAIIPDFWDDVERNVRSYFSQRFIREKEMDAFYDAVIPEQDRARAMRIVRDLCGDRSHALREIVVHINNARTERDKRFWQYIKRECRKIWGDVI